MSRLRNSIVIAVTVLSVTACSESADSEQKTAQAPETTEKVLPEVLVLASQEQPLTTSLELRGTTQPERYVEVKAQTDGIVTSPPIMQGTDVTEGQILCELDKADREAVLLEAKAALNEAISNASGSASLAKKGFVTQTRVSSDQARLEEARARLEQAEIDLSRTVITAPFAGRLEEDTAEQGTLLQRGDTCAAIIDFNPVQVIVYPSEKEVSSLMVGAPVNVTVATGQAFQATVSFIAKVADETTRTFRVEAVADNPEGHIRSGMTATVRIGLADIRAHFIPQSALILSDSGILGVRVVQDSANTVAFKPVELVRDNNQGMWVRGLSPQERVIIQGQNYVGDGQQVIPKISDVSSTQ